MCGSGMKAVMLAHDILLAGSARIAVAGGMESMTNAPYLLDRARAGYRMGHYRVLDHMFLDGLEDAYDKGRLMGTFAEDCAQSYSFTREAQDEFSLSSLMRAQKAATDGSFAAEIATVTVKSGKINREVSQDELPQKAKIDKIATLKPAFREGGSVTAANSSSISDGAAALVLMRRSEAERRGIQPLAVIAGQAAIALAPALYPIAPIGAIRMLAERTGWSMGEVDLFEINEAFAVVAMAAMRDLGLPAKRSTCTGAPVLSDIRSAHRARGFLSPCLLRLRNTDLGAELHRSALEAGKLPQWRWNGSSNPNQEMLRRRDTSPYVAALIAEAS